MFLSFLFIILVYFMIKYSDLSMFYALTGLNLWFTKMIPALLPFMILSTIAIKLNLTEKIASYFSPLLYPLFHVQKNVIYCIFLGFLCGFPMGAKVTNDLYFSKKIKKEEACYLLSFCNNIGPIYFCSFVLPLLNLKNPAIFLFGMYGVPFLWGIFLRYTKYRNILKGNRELMKKQTKEVNTIKITQIPVILEEAITSSLTTIASLGGYMIIFNCMNLPFHIYFHRKPIWISPILEITGGLSFLGNRLPLYSLIILTFGGISCIAQTYSCIKNTDLSIYPYIINKFIVMGITVIYYLCCFLFFPNLRFLLLK